jgi:hypothetical protein
MVLGSRRPAEDAAARGQALVEFALVLPLLIVLLVMAIDFGRVFFGWVSLTNTARIAADYAGQHPSIQTNSAVRDDYEALIADHVAGCILSPSDLNDAAYDPTFSDSNADGNDDGWGDHVTVTLRCEFDLLTPLAGGIVGDPVGVQAVAVFPVRFGALAGPGGGGGGGGGGGPCTQALIPDLINRTVVAARQKWVDNGFDPALFTANPDIDDNLVSSQTFTPSANVNDCVDPIGQAVSVTSVPPPPCPSGQAQVPDLIGLLVADARTAWAASFSGSFNPSNADNTKTVLTQTTNPVTSPPVGGCAPVSAEVTISYGDPPPQPCDVPNMIGDTYAEASAAWSGAGFTTTLASKGNASGTVNQQTPTHPGTVSCDVAGEVTLKK